MTSSFPRRGRAGTWPATALIALLLASCGGSTPPASVAGDVITEEDLDRATSVFQALADAQQAPCGDSSDLRESDPPEAACNRFSLGILIQIRLAEAYAEAHDLSVPDREIRQTTQRFSDGLGEGVLDSALAANDATTADLRAIVRGSLLLDEAARELAYEELGDEGLQQAYDERLVDFTIVESSHILVETEEEAQAVYDQVTAPGFTFEDFGELAAEVSIDPNAAQNGGSLGNNAASGYVPEFAEAVVALEAGEVSEPVQTEFGWHVIWLVDKEVTPFEEAREQILGDLQSKAFFTYVRDREAAGDIEVDPSFGRFDPQALTVVAIRSTDPSASATPTPVNASPAPEG